LTFQFKVYIQMSGMTLGSIIGAEKRVKDYEVRMRRYRKVRRDAEVWRRYEEDYVNEGKSVQGMQRVVDQAARTPAVAISATGRGGATKRAEKEKPTGQDNGL